MPIAPIWVLICAAEKWWVINFDVRFTISNWTAMDRLRNRKLAPVGKLALLRLDGDLYESTRVCLEGLYPHLTVGGFCIIDDYALAGCRRAVDEYFSQKAETPAMIEIGGGPVWWRKC